MKAKEGMKEIFNRYTEDSSLTNFTLIQVWPERLCGTRGINSARFFKVVGFQQDDTMRMRDLGTHDLILFEDTAIIKQLTVYLDKSYCLIGTFEVDEYNVVLSTLYFK